MGGRGRTLPAFLWVHLAGLWCHWLNRSTNIEAPVNIIDNFTVLRQDLDQDLDYRNIQTWFYFFQNTLNVLNFLNIFKFSFQAIFQTFYYAYVKPILLTSCLCNHTALILFPCAYCLFILVSLSCSAWEVGTVSLLHISDYLPILFWETQSKHKSVLNKPHPHLVCLKATEAFYHGNHHIIPIIYPFKPLSENVNTSHS